MFSFRELVESMEERTFDSASPTAPPTRFALSGKSNDVPKDIARQQTSQHRAETTDENAGECRRRESLWIGSQEQQELRKRNCREEKMASAVRTDEQSASSQIMDAESSQVKEQEIDVSVIKRNHLSSTQKHLNLSVSDLCDVVQRRHCTLPQDTSFRLDPVSRDQALGTQGLDTSMTSVLLEHQPICSAQSSKYGGEHDSSKHLLTQTSRLINEKNVQLSKHRHPETYRRTVRRIDTKNITRGRRCRSVKEKHVRNLSDENISERVEVTNVKSTQVREDREGGDKCDSNIPKSQISSQYVEVCRQEIPVKEIITLPNCPESHKISMGGACDLKSFTTDCLSSTDAAATSLPVNMNVYSDNHGNTQYCPTNDGHEWTSHSFRDSEEVQTFSSSRYASKQGEKAPDSKRRITHGHLGYSESATNVPSSLCTSDNNAKKISTQAAQSLRERMNTFRNKKQFREVVAGLVRGLQNDKMTKTKRCKSRAAASIGDHETPRSSSPLGFRCQLCSSWWRDEASLERHHRLHAPARPFACPDCPSRFNQLVHLQIHRRTHTGEKPFRCDTCNASFSRKDRLRSHERRHSGEQPYTCPYCPAAFRNAASLRGHVPAHAHHPPFTCRLCHATFAHLATFTAHWRLHN